MIKIENFHEELKKAKSIRKELKGNEIANEIAYWFDKPWGAFGFADRGSFIMKEIINTAKKGPAGMDIEYTKKYRSDLLKEVFQELAVRKIPVEKVAKFLSSRLELKVSVLKPKPWLREFKPTYIRIMF